MQKKYADDALTFLRSAEGSSFQHPRVVFAVLIHDRDNGTYRLQLAWVEADPSVNAIEIRSGDKNPPVGTPFDQSEVTSIKTMASHTILFPTAFEWGANSSLGKTLGSKESLRGLQVRLIGGKAVVTDWFPVDVYQDGIWLSKE